MAPADGETAPLAIPRRLALLGPPAAGKGTQGSRLAGMTGVPHVSAGNLLRRSIEQGDPYQIGPLVAAGFLVPHETVERILVPALGDGFVLDGYPRTRTQGERLDRFLHEGGRPLEAVVELAVDGDTLRARLAERAARHVRSDDHPEVFERRLDDYRRHMPAIHDHYGARLISVDGRGSPDEVFERIVQALRRRSARAPDPAG